MSNNEDDDALLINVICFTCPYLFRCGERSEHNPIDCVWFRDWLIESVEHYEDEYEYEE